MKTLANHQKQRGATLIMGMIMLTLITVGVITAYNLSSTNLKSVGNMQFRQEAIAAAHKAIEQIIASDFTKATGAETINVDLNHDSTVDYVVTVAQPTCVRAYVGGEPVKSEATLPNMSKTGFWNTVWDLSASVTDPVSGASVQVHSAIRVLRTDVQKAAECP